MNICYFIIILFYNKAAITIKWKTTNNKRKENLKQKIFNLCHQFVLLWTSLGVRQLLVYLYN
ncbi:hypothetical protein Mgra_00001106 [Meloidogyne graminicola]|uniref:Uncharacterized protein n=1 Tax=Meloidogyne graminicola TaxID=189291 RepID=A0A8T0A092_9BILA|nr:hypothetical protein Mgra_00001106 [Meloidogyne graminicola]